MSLRFADSFDRYKLGTTADSQVLGGLSAYWTSIANATCAVISGGRNGQCVQLGAGVNFFKTLTHETGWTVAWAYYVNPGTSGTLQNTMVNETNNNIEILRVGLNADGTVQVNAGTFEFVASPSTGIHFNKWEHFEINYDLVAGAGPNAKVGIKRHSTLTVNGQVFDIAPNADEDTGILIDSLVGGSPPTVNVHGITATQTNNFLDDYVIFDHNNGVNDGAIGDVKILGIVPNGDTSVHDFTASSGTVHFSLINIIPPPGDSSSIFDATVNAKDIWDWQNIPSFTGTIPGVVISIYARKDDEGTRSFEIVTGATGTENQSPEFFLNDGYVYHHHSLDVDPNGNIAWTVANFNSKQFGVKVIS